MFPVAILAGGLATRLRPLTEKIPKSLVEVAGEPFIAHQLRLLKSAGADRVVICTGFLGEQVEAFVGDGSRFGLKVSYSPDGPKLLGTAGALRQALPLLDDCFFVVYGDSYLPCDYAAVQRAFVESGKDGLMTVFRNEGRWDTSNVEFDGTRIVAYSKTNRTPRMAFIDYGLGAFRRSMMESLPAGEPIDLAKVYEGLLAWDRLAAYEVTQRFYEVGSHEGIRELSEYLGKGVVDR
jgi:NDP-sugar pyrophosphorylase family protein